MRALGAELRGCHKQSREDTARSMQAGSLKRCVANLAPTEVRLGWTLAATAGRRSPELLVPER